MGPAIELDVNDAVFSSLYPHISGLVALAYAPDGRTLYTGGSDSFIRAHNVDNPAEDSTLIEYFEGDVTSLNCSFDSLVACDTEGQTALFSLEDSHAFKALLTRADPGSAARCVRFGVGGRKIAVATDELTVKVIDVRSPTENVQLLEGHTKAVRAVSWNPDGSLLTTSSCDGSLRIWDMASAQSEVECLKVLDGLFPSSDPAALTPYSEAHWHPNGKHFAVATSSHQIALYSRDSWSRTSAFTQDGHNSEISALAWSPNGHYIASAGLNNTVIVWDMDSLQPIYRTKLSSITDTEPSIVTALAWRTGPGGNSLSIADSSGRVTRWDSVIPNDSGRPHPSDGPPYGVARAAAPSRAPAQAQREATKKAMEEDMFADEDEDNWIDDDMNGAYKDGPAGGPEALDEDELPAPLFGNDKARTGGLTVTSSSVVAGQAAFQPGATPFKDKRRYLAFNDIGVIHIVDRDSHNLVHVEFHDRSAHQGHQFDDNYKFEMACLGQRGVLYACPARGDLASVINYRPYNTWAQAADWQHELPQGESVTAIGLGGVSAFDSDDLSPAVGTGCIVAATSAGYLRFFGGSGLQTHFIDLGEDIVSLAVGKEWVFVVHRAIASTSDGRQNLNYTIIDADTFEYVQQGHLPLMKKISLTWIGFTSDEIPALYKSNGVLSLLSRARRPGQARWVAALDSNTLARREGKQESYWPVAVGSKEMQCVILKGEAKYPFFPTPLLQDLPLQLPTLNLDGQQGLLEENYLRDAVVSNHIKDGAHPDDYAAQSRITKASLDTDKQLLILTQTACKAERLEQALEAARLMSQPQSLDAAIKIAAFFHLPGLQERIGLIKEARTGESAVDRDRRESKWGHLVDNRTIVDSSVQVEEYNSNPRRNGSSTAASLSRPLDNVAKRSLGDGAALNARPIAAAVKLSKRNDSGHGSSEQDMEQDMPPPFDDESMQQVDEEELEETQEYRQPEAPAPVAKAKAHNPFAKTAMAVSTPPTSSNPFARKGAAGIKGTDLKRSGSFFDRVEGTASTSKEKGKGKKVANKDGSRQSTLFGMAPPTEEPAKKSGKGKKRKSTAAAEGEVEETQDTQKSLASFLGKEKATSVTDSPAETQQTNAAVSEEEGSEQTSKRQRVMTPEEATQEPTQEDVPSAGPTPMEVVTEG